VVFGLFATAPAASPEAPPALTTEPARAARGNFSAGSGGFISAAPRFLRRQA
jgi:hypothetical protein